MPYSDDSFLLCCCSCPWLFTVSLYLLENLLLLLINYQMHPQARLECVGHRSFMKLLWRLLISLAVVIVRILWFDRRFWMCTGWPVYLIFFTFDINFRCHSQMCLKADECRRPNNLSCEKPLTGTFCYFVLLIPGVILSFLVSIPNLRGSPFNAEI